MAISSDCHGATRSQISTGVFQSNPKHREPRIGFHAESGSRSSTSLGDFWTGKNQIPGFPAPEIRKQNHGSRHLTENDRVRYRMIFYSGSRAAMRLRPETEFVKTSAVKLRCSFAFFPDFSLRQKLSRSCRLRPTLNHSSDGTLREPLTRSRISLPVAGTRSCTRT